MKDFKVLDIKDSYIKATNQRVLIFELAEVQWSDYTLPSGNRTYNFGMDGEKYVFNFNSDLSKSITQAAHKDEIVSLNLSEFTSKIERRNAIVEKVHIHTSVDLEQSSTVSRNDENFEYKSKELNGGQLAMLANGLFKGLFPKPTSKELLVKSLKSGGCRLYFHKDYYETLTEKMNDYFYNGSFANSNAYAEWTDLKEAIDGAEIVMEINKVELRPYFKS